MSTRIAILVHKTRADFWASNYLLALMRKKWEELGLSTVTVNGAGRYVEADLAVLHVNLTTVPEDYMSLAGRYPAVINGKVRTISKRSFTTLRVERDDGYAGPVIVKTDLNAGARRKRRRLPGPGRRAVRSRASSDAFPSDGPAAFAGIATRSTPLPSPCRRGCGRTHGSSWNASFRNVAATGTACDDGSSSATGNAAASPSRILRS